jgi:hypothetical protein
MQTRSKTVVDRRRCRAGRGRTRRPVDLYPARKITDNPPAGGGMILIEYGINDAGFGFDPMIANMDATLAAIRAIANVGVAGDPACQPELHQRQLKRPRRAVVVAQNRHQRRRLHPHDDLPGCELIFPGMVY